MRRGSREYAKSASNHVSRSKWDDIAVGKAIDRALS